MPTTQALREQRANIWDSMTAIMETATRESRDLTGEERQTYDRAETDLDRLGDDIERSERHDSRAAEFARVDRTGVVPPADGPGDQDQHDRAYAQAFNAWTRGGQDALSSDQRRLLNTGFVAASDLPRNAAGVSPNTAGGFLVPPEFRQKIVEAMTFVAAMRQYAEVISTSTGAALPWPTVDDTANEGAILAENTQVTEQDVLFGQASIGAHTYTSKLVRVSLQLLNDNAFNLEGWLATALGNRIGRVQNRHFTVGTGVNQPQGIVTGAPVAKVGAAGQVTTVTYDDLVDLTDAIDPAYSGTGEQRFMLSQQARKVIRKLKDADGRPLWEPSLQAGTSDTLLGYGLALNNNVPAPGASAKSLLFGNFSEAYLVRDVQDFQLLRLTERYADFLQVGFLGFQRSDGMVQNAAAVRAYQHPAA